MLENLPDGPLQDVHVPDSLKSDRPAVERGYDLGFTADGQPLRGRPVFSIDREAHSEEHAAGACQKKPVVPKARTAAIATYFCGHGFSYG